MTRAQHPNRWPYQSVITTTDPEEELKKSQHTHENYSLSYIKCKNFRDRVSRAMEADIITAGPELEKLIFDKS